MKSHDRARTNRFPEGDDRPQRSRRRLLTSGRVALCLACLFGGTIIVNAVMMQNEKHPTPLFRNAIRQAESYPTPPQRPETTPRSAATATTPAASLSPAGSTATSPAPVRLATATPQALPAARASDAPPVAAGDPLLADLQRELARKGFFKGEANGRPSPALTQAIREFQFSQRVAVDGKPSEALLRELQSASRNAMRDELADLLKRGGAPERPAAAADDKPNRTVMDIQRALNKAGYGPLTEDGQMGPSTKAALAKFETDRKLPPRGEPRGPVLRVLAAASGIPISQ